MIPMLLDFYRDTPEYAAFARTLAEARQEAERIAQLLPDEPCGHPGCRSHVTHPCEGCGRIWGRYPEQETK